MSDADSPPPPRQTGAPDGGGRGDRTSPRAHLRRARRVSALVAVALLLVAALAAAGTFVLVRAEAEARFEADVDEARSSLEREFRVYVEALQGLRGFVAQSEFVSFDEWHGYVAMLDLEDRYGALRALSLNVHVPAADRAAFEDAARNDTASDPNAEVPFRIWPDGDRPYHVVVKYIAPAETNQAAVGFDIASEATRRNALERAARADAAVATAPVQLVQSGTAETGILILLPVYVDAVREGTREPSLEAVAAFVTAVVNFDELVDQVLANLGRPLSVRVTDAGPSAGPDLDTGAEALAVTIPVARPFHAGAWLDVAGRHLRIEATSTASYVQAPFTFAPFAVAVVGIAIAMLAGGLAYGQLTRRVRVQEEADRLTRRLRESEARRALMINNVAHELNGTLTPVGLQVGIITSGRARDPEQSARGREILDRNLDRLKRLVGDLLDVGRLEAGQLQVAIAPVDMSRLAHEAVADFEAAAAAKRQVLTIDAPPMASAAADPQRASQVLRNLLSNALKFTPAGGHVRVLVQPEPGAVRVIVEDSGPGLTADQIRRLFQPFSQVHEPGRDAVPGTGLGLFISKGLVEAMGGSTGCESPGRGAGSRFWFSLPSATRGDEHRMVTTVGADVASEEQPHPLRGHDSRKPPGETVQMALGRIVALCQRERPFHGVVTPVLGAPFARDPGHCCNNVPGLDGLRKKRVDLRFVRSVDGEVHVWEGREKDSPNPRISVPDAGQKFEARHGLHAVIGQHEVNPSVGKDGEGLLPAFSQNHLSGRKIHGEDFAQGVENVLFIVHNQQRQRVDDRGVSTPRSRA